MRQIYFDHQSSTPVLPEVFEAMRPFFTEAFGNPSSLHQEGLRARDAVAQAREQCANFLNSASPEEIIFTSCGTEAVNLAMKGAALAGRRSGRHIVLSSIEHPAVANSVEFLEQDGFTATRVKVDAEGRIDPAAVKAAINDATSLVCVHLANHDIGTIQPIREISDVCGESGARLFVDAVPAAGWLPIDVRALGADLLALSPHRFYGPKGVGILYRNSRARLTSQIHGGPQEHSHRAGTENVPSIVGAGVAAQIAALEMPQRIAHTTKLQRRLWDALRAEVPFIKLNGPPPGPGRISTNLNLSVQFIEGEGLMLILDTQGIAIASGTSCVGKSLKISPVLAAIGVEPSLAQGTVILSPGTNNTTKETDQVVAALAKAVKKLRGMSPMWDEFQRNGIRPETKAKSVRR